MAASSTGADWQFPTDLPGSWQQQQEQQNQASKTDSHPKPSTDVPPSTEGSPPKRRRRHYPPRQCRICLEVVEPTFHYEAETSVPASPQAGPRVSYISEDGGRLLSPCRCKGSQKYVHEQCLELWRRADPAQKRNYWECPTCRYRYRLQLLTWASWIRSTAAQLSLTLLIFVTSVFILGFAADPILNFYLDPVHTITTGGGPTGSLVYEDEEATWIEHMAKGVASLGLLGFAKFMLTLSPFHWFRFGGGGGGTGRDRLRNLSWITIVIGVITFLLAVWKGVRAWSRKTLESASERVLDVPGSANDDEDLENDST